MSEPKPGDASAPIDEAISTLVASVDGAISALVAAEYDDGEHPVVARVIDELRDALESYENRTSRQDAGKT